MEEELLATCTPRPPYRYSARLKKTLSPPDTGYRLLLEYWAKNCERQLTSALSERRRARAKRRESCRRSLPRCTSRLFPDVRGTPTTKTIRHG